MCKCGKWRCKQNGFDVKSFGPFETEEEAEKIIGNGEMWQEDDNNSFISIDIIEVKQPQNFKNPITECNNE